MGQAIADFELKVLSRLWELGGRGRVSDILQIWRDDSGGSGAPGYTTVLKALQKLRTKGVVTHEEGDGRAYIYVAQVTRREASKSRLRQLVDTVFGGDRLAFAHTFLEEANLSAEEIHQLRSLVENLEGQSGNREDGA